MSVFGDGEAATRSLSNLFIAGATLSLYFMALHAWGRRVALSVAIIFSVMYMPTAYAVETRSYALTILLAALSSMFMIRYLDSLKLVSWRETVINPWGFALILANFLLLFTHYYNAFFLAAQGIFLGAWFLARYRVSPATLIGPAWICLTPLALFVATWGSVMWASYQSRTDRYTVEDGVAETPVSLIKRYILDYNFREENVLVIFGVLGLIAVGWACLRLVRAYRTRDVAVIWMVLSFVLPAVIAVAAFALAGHERYHHRYFLFAVPALAVLVALGLEVPFRALARWRPLARFYVATGPLVNILAAGLLLAPDGYSAAMATMHNHRGWAEQIVQLVNNAPEGTYIIYDASWRPVLQWYLDRLRNERRHHAEVTGRVTRAEERAGSFSIQGDENLIREHDFLIVAFTHDRASGFPTLREYLDETYRLEHEMFDRLTRGLAIYRTNPASNIQAIDIDAD
jgi:uncharacterized membrane protein